MRTKGSFVLFFFFFIFPLALAQLRPGFYGTSCPRAESIVSDLVQKRFSADNSVPAALLRMHFHDCFVTGCDASILIDSTNQTQSEKESGANQTVREFELIDEIKKALEAECPSTVSCADIITLATRDAVTLAGGPRYTVLTGRRDGLRSNVDDVDLPGPQISVPDAQQVFQAKGLTSDEMVSLLGAHTVGFAHCSFFKDRLTNFQGTGLPDPTMNVTLIPKLRRICDAASTDNFGPKTFASAMVNMGNIQVLVGNAGEIRQNCRAFNPLKASSCPEAESIIFNVVQRRFNTDRSITGALLRMHFHDCFSGNGCDASILIDSTIRSQPEKDSGSNLTVRGYEIIDEIKNALEQKCPSTVSCADIIALATRDAVALAGGLNYSLPTGRRDGLRSNADEVNLPGTSLSVPNVLQMFAEKGFNTTETVAILGAHTVGVVHCSFFQDRLPDSDMDPAFAQELSKACEASSGSDDPMTNLDRGTPTSLDSQYYNQTLFKRGVLQIDQALALDASTHDIVAHFANDEDDFQLSFANVMVKLGSLQVLTDGQGEIRQNCRAFNRDNNASKPNRGRALKRA
ncbi:hypothetical protein CUMW_048910 [Citrus unshiu]|nr:hypothetical protein CUMW_048910 [Citrus unshiu]